jgi:hypothetical protein
MRSVLAAAIVQIWGECWVQKTSGQRRAVIGVESYWRYGGGRNIDPEDSFELAGSK